LRSALQFSPTTISLSSALVALLIVRSRAPAENYGGQGSV
jgi:hypothetical protein